MWKCCSVNPCSKRIREDYVREQLLYENDTNVDIKEEFEKFFIAKKVNKMNIFEFNNLIDRCEINVA